MEDQTDEARLARLTELARRVYGAETVLHCYCEPEKAWSVRILGDRIVMLIEGEHSVGALEAALLTLADEARIPLTADQVTRDALESCRRDREALTKRFREEQAKLAILDGAFREASAGADRAEAKLEKVRELAKWGALVDPVSLNHILDEDP